LTNAEHQARHREKTAARLRALEQVVAANDLIVPAVLRKTSGSSAPVSLRKTATLDADEQLTAIRKQQAEHLGAVARFCSEGRMAPAQRATAAENARKYAAGMKEICRTAPLKLPRRVVGEAR
jgi:delta-aminolevulinic acid dehydratase/porphobilinogen synthase